MINTAVESENSSCINNIKAFGIATTTLIVLSSPIPQLKVNSHLLEKEYAELARSNKNSFTYLADLTTERVQTPQNDLNIFIDFASYLINQAENFPEEFSHTLYKNLEKLLD